MIKLKVKHFVYLTIPRMTKMKVSFLTLYTVSDVDLI